MEIIEAALVRNDASIRNAARDLNVPSADLRKLVLLDQRLADASTEAVELHLDECEANLREGLRSDDPKRRDAISMFFLRNTQRAARRAIGRWCSFFDFVRYCFQGDWQWRICDQGFCSHCWRRRC